MGPVCLCGTQAGATARRKADERAADYAALVLTLRALSGDGGEHGDGAPPEGEAAAAGGVAAPHWKQALLAQALLTALLQVSRRRALFLNQDYRMLCILS